MPNLVTKMANQILIIIFTLYMIQYEHFPLGGHGIVCLPKQLECGNMWESSKHWAAIQIISETTGAQQIPPINKIVAAKLMSCGEVHKRPMF